MKATTITFRLSEEEKAQIEQIAIANDLSVSQVIRKAIREFLDKTDKTQD